VELPDAVVVILTAVSDTAQTIALKNLGVRFILNKGIESYKLLQVLHQAAGRTNGNHS
jgi:DNA-binding NarL/FixJ family response regulator